MAGFWSGPIGLLCPVVDRCGSRFLSPIWSGFVAVRVGYNLVRSSRGKVVCFRRDLQCRRWTGVDTGIGSGSLDVESKAGWVGLGREGWLLGFLFLSSLGSVFGIQVEVGS